MKLRLAARVVDQRRAQMREIDARAELLRHRHHVVVGAAPRLPTQKQMPFAADGTASNSAW